MCCISHVYGSHIIHIQCSRHTYTIMYPWSATNKTWHCVQTQIWSPHCKSFAMLPAQCIFKEVPCYKLLFVTDTVGIHHAKSLYAKKKKDMVPDLPTRCQSVPDYWWLLRWSSETSFAAAQKTSRSMSTIVTSWMGSNGRVLMSHYATESVDLNRFSHGVTMGTNLYFDMKWSCDWKLV